MFSLFDDLLESSLGDNLPVPSLGDDDPDEKLERLFLDLDTYSCLCLDDTSFHSPISPLNLLESLLNRLDESGFESFLEPLRPVPTVFHSSVPPSEPDERASEEDDDFDDLDENTLC